MICFFRFQFGALHVSPLAVDMSTFGPVVPHKQEEFTCFDLSNTGLWWVALWSSAAAIPSCARRDCRLFMLEKTWTDYLSLDLWVVQWHTGAAMELHNEALWRQRQASLAAPHPGYLISERSLTGAVARSRDSPQDQRRKCQTTYWGLGWWRNHRAVSKCRIGDAGGDGGPTVSQFTRWMWVCN